MWFRNIGRTAEAGSDEPLLVAAFFLFILVNGALIWRRHKPFEVHVLVVACSAVSIALAYLDGPLFALAISLYSLGRYCDDEKKSYLGAGLAIALLGVSKFLAAETTTPFVMSLLMAFVVWYVGRRIRARGEYLRVLRERADQLEREQMAEAEKAVAEERTRIARELHDIVAHQVSLMTVQAGAAKTLAAKDPHAALQAMTAVEEAGRQALNELRHLMGVLRPSKQSNYLGPQPGHADIPRLIEELKRTGLEVTLDSNNIYTGLPARVDLSIYRIVQEALTNVLKHAGPQAQVEVIVRCDKQGVTIKVTDNGRGSTSLPGSGHGIAGMRERTHLLGGNLEASALPGGGFSVIARLPILENS